MNRIIMIFLFFTFFSHVFTDAVISLKQLEQSLYLKNESGQELIVYVAVFSFSSNDIIKWEEFKLKPYDEATHTFKDPNWIEWHGYYDKNIKDKPLTLKVNQVILESNKESNDKIPNVKVAFAFDPGKIVYSEAKHYNWKVTFSRE